MSLPYPNVPNLPGVPQLPRRAGTVIPELIIAAGEQALFSSLWQATQAPPAWGVFDSSNNQVIDPDSVVDFGNRNEWEVSSFPVQRGGFASYNKVVVPFETSVRMTKGGTQNDRLTFLQQIANIAGDTNLYSVMTPEWSYLNCNVTRYEVTRRGAAGAFFLDVDLFFIQINQVEGNQGQTTNAQDPTALPANNLGNVQVQPIDPQTALAAAPALSF